MQKRLRIRLGVTKDELVVIDANRNEPYAVNSSGFNGHLKLRIRGFDGIHTHEVKQNIPTCEYFHKPGRSRTFSLQFAGRFSRDYNGDELVIRCRFEEPLKMLPFGFSVFQSFWARLDPGSDFELSRSASSRIQSPLLTAMNVIHEGREDEDEWYTHSHSSVDSTETLNQHCLLGLWSDELKENFWNASRKSFYADSSNRRAAIFKSEAYYAFEAFNPYFIAQRLRLGIPGFSFDLTTITGQQPVLIEMGTRNSIEPFFVLELSLV